MSSPDELLKQVALPVVVDLSGITNAELISLRGELARVRAECDAWAIAVAGVTATRSGRDAQATLCRELGVSAGRARELLDASAACAQSQTVRQAASGGRLGVEKTRALKGLSDEAASRLLVENGDATVDDFKAAAERVRLDELVGGERSKRQRAQRCVSFFTGPDGCVGMRTMLPTLDGARVKKRLEDIADATYRREFPDRAETLGGHAVDQWGARLADALVALATGDAPASGKPAVVIVVDEQRLTAEVVNEGPIPLCEVASLIESTKVDLFAAVRGMNGEVVKFGRSRRFASLIQRLAMIVRDGGRCTQSGCRVPWDRCHAHHRVPFDEGGPTDVGNLKHQCTAHHQHEHHHAGEHIDETGPPSRPPLQDAA
jgi:hypothetical protein